MVKKVDNRPRERTERELKELLEIIKDNPKLGTNELCKKLFPMRKPLYKTYRSRLSRTSNLLRELKEKGLVKKKEVIVNAHWPKSEWRIT